MGARPPPGVRTILSTTPGKLDGMVPLSCRGQVQDGGVWAEEDMQGILCSVYPSDYTLVSEQAGASPLIPSVCLMDRCPSLPVFSLPLSPLSLLSPVKLL